MFSFSSPYFFLFVLIIPLLWILKYRSEKPDSANSNIDSASAGIQILLGSGNIKSEPGWLLRNRTLILLFFQSLALLFLIIALARPQSGTFSSEDISEARDILITVDASGSMRALDFELKGSPVSRLEVLKSVVESFINERKGDRIGLIVFGAEVFTQCPLTLDHNLLQQYVQTLEIGMAGDSTSLGDALALSVKRLREIESNSKAIIFVTDGMQTSGQLQPRQAAEIAKRYGIKVYTIGIGGKDPAPLPVQDAFGRTAIIYQNIPVDEKTLEEIAQMTGGKYFNAKNTDELKSIYREIDSLEVRKMKTPRLVARNEYFRPFLICGIISLIFGEILARTWLRVIS
ncbi:MAG TPA: VWA domain-containing protein [Oligoflexia bacterium]|nr:VWA domain-containing protein [Oligoflexia bacterium]HMP49031.1 VWA domain-containing protein [Oligoflexia bacterium]